MCWYIYVILSNCTCVIFKFWDLEISSRLGSVKVCLCLVLYHYAINNALHMAIGKTSNYKFHCRILDVLFNSWEEFTLRELMSTSLRVATMLVLVALSFIAVVNMIRVKPFKPNAQKIISRDLQCEEIGYEIPNLHGFTQDSGNPWILVS